MSDFSQHIELTTKYFPGSECLQYFFLSPWDFGIQHVCSCNFFFQHSTFLVTSTSMILISLSTSLSPLGNLCLFVASVPSPFCTLRRRIHFIFFPLNNALTTCVNKLLLPFLRGPSVSFTALSFCMCFKNVLFILTPAVIFLCSILHLCLS